MDTLLKNIAEYKAKIKRRWNIFYTILAIMAFILLGIGGN